MRRDAHGPEALLWRLDRAERHVRLVPRLPESPGPLQNAALEAVHRASLTMEERRDQLTEVERRARDAEETVASLRRRLAEKESALTRTREALRAAEIRADKAEDDLARLYGLIQRHLSV
ncbi:MAG: hypothetical protein JO048_10480 [Methylobacteriaceae bacterium]|nr:hypothetical protein [Methylobacteriaceae bacterium]